MPWGRTWRNATISASTTTFAIDVVVEYSLRDIMRPIGVATYRLQGPLPAPFRDVLPTAAELAAEVESVMRPASDRDALS